MQLIVLGMHRSGTSVVSRLLNLMGAYFGPEGVATNANPENPKGFWERRDVRALNDSILHSIGCDWNRLSTFDLERVPHAVLEHFHAGAARIVLDMDGHRPWFLKEPRLMLLLPLWRKHLEVPVCVHVRRQPIETAASLLQRNQIPIPVGLAMWEFHKRLVLAASDGLPQVQVAHRELMTDPRAAVDRLLRDLQAAGVAGLREPTAREVETFVDGSLYREREERDDLRAFHDVPQAAMFRRIDAGLPMEDDPGWEARTRAVLAGYERTLPPLLAGLQQRLEDKAKHLAAAEADAHAERDRANRLKSASLKQEAKDQERERRIAALQAELAVARQAQAEAAAGQERTAVALAQASAGVASAASALEAERRQVAESRMELLLARNQAQEAEVRAQELDAQLQRERSASTALRETLEALQRQLAAQSREIDTWRFDSHAQAERLRETAAALAEAQARARDGSREVLQMTRLLVAAESTATALASERDQAREEAARQRARAEESVAELSALSLRLAATEAERARLQANAPDRAGGKLRALVRRLRARVGRTDPLAEDRRLILESGWFDAGWYLQAYPDVAASGMDGAEHYLRHGGAEGRSPGPRFDSAHYLAAHADVAAANLNPLVHFLRHGMGEGRAPMAAGQKETDS